jgi:predicted AlkP superfamily pyrophosphatase or phosphodiesterase
MQPTPTAPSYGRGCLTDLLPALLPVGGAVSGILPIEVEHANPIVLLVLDGVGWEQLESRSRLTPVLSAMQGGPITSVAPSTTATALTSITTGLTPGEHGIVGYRMMIDGDVMNALRWGSPSMGDARRTHPPDALQPYEPFLGELVDYVSKAEFAKTGFTGAHLRGARLHPYRTTAVMVNEIGRVLRAGAPFVYAYYDGVDKVAHEYGLDDRYDAELAFIDRLVGEVIAASPSGTQVVVTADHGQVDCGDDLRPISPEVLELTEALSGEARFRWLHAVPGAEHDLLEAAAEAHGNDAWVRSLDQMIDDRWLGHTVRAEVLDRYGSVALLPFEAFGFDDPDDTGPFSLIGRHGSLTSAEMLVPLLVATA